MSDKRVERVKTSISEAEMARVFLDVISELYGITLSKAQLSILMAQNNLETGHRNFMFNYNIGNITHVPNDGFDYYMSGDTTKNKQGKWVPVTVKFRAYPDIYAGAKDYIQNLKKRGNGSVWQAIMNANPVAFSKALKQTYYYEASEKDTIDPVTKKVIPGYTSGIVAGTQAFNNSNTYDKAVSGNFEKSQVVQPAVSSGGGGTLSRIEKILNMFLTALSEKQMSDRFIKKCAYKQFLLPNNLLIKITSSNFEDSMEFARILCATLDEELFSDAYIYTDRKNIEVTCTVYGPKTLCINSTLQLCDSLADSFKIATKKIGGCEVKTVIYPNKNSSYQELDIKLAQICYNRFHLKFVNGINNG